MSTRRTLAAFFVALFFAAAPSARGDVYNLKVVTDANPDYSDLDSLVHSATSNWETDKDKMWAMFYWNHIARRQTNPMELHGKAETDPIRQFNDYGYTMCSTISGINCMIWQHMGYKVKYYDIAVHTVPEVFYDNGWHHYDNSLSNIYTLCDGKTIAGVEDVGKTLGCALSGGKEEPGHIALYHMMSEEDVATGLRAKFVTIGTDSSALRSEGVLAQGSPHPRSYGTFPRVLGKYARDEKVLSLPEAIHRMTGLAASQIGVRDRGLIRDRHIADLVVFNAATIKDTATYERPHQYPTGIEYVVVNGVTVLNPKGLTGARPGRPVYGPARQP